ncbi:hypothetical protein [Streptosporangium sp. G12]
MTVLDEVTFYDGFPNREGSIATGVLVIPGDEPVILPARMLFGPGSEVRICARVPWATYWARFGRSHPDAHRAKAEYRRRNR